MPDYNTSINVLGSISDINVIIETIKYFQKTQDIEAARKEFVEGNAFGFNISSSRKRFFSLIKKLFLTEADEPDRQFFLQALASDRPNSSYKKSILYLEIFRKNELFKDITEKLIYPKYQDNMRLISSREIADFLRKIEEGTKIAEWSDSTVKTVASKYIGFMKRLGYFEPENRYKSMIAYPYPAKELLTYIVYLLNAAGKNDHEIYESDLYSALMLEENEKVELLKQGSLAGYYKFNFTGQRSASFELNYESEEIIDAIFS